MGWQAEGIPSLSEGGTLFRRQLPEASLLPDPKRILVLSDMHFGTRESSINNNDLRGALVRYICSRAPYSKVVFTGDLLDANLSTMRLAIEGGRRRRTAGLVVGLRTFLSELDRAKKDLSGGGGLKDVADRWVYIPGNHDYMVWDLLANKVAFEDVLDRGESLGTTVKSPLMVHSWKNGSAFIAGIFQQFGVRDRVDVEYPNHVEVLPDGRSIWFTHGHYVDRWQTRFNDLREVFATRADDESNRRRIFIETAQYQTMARALSFTPETTRVVDSVFGPGGWTAKLLKLLVSLSSALQRLLFLRENPSSGKALSTRLLENILVYVRRFSAVEPPPKWFVFGHTHRQDQGRTKDGEIEVVNAGSCYVDRGMPITFVEIEVGPPEGELRFKLMCVDGTCQVRDTA